MFKKLLLLVVFVVLGGLIWFFFLQPAQETFELEEGYSYLYDGNSLDGWRVVGGESTFEAAGEAIVGRHGPGTNTFLRTDKSYGDFSLKMQMRWDEFGNSGVMFRAHQRGGDGRVYGYQYELDFAERAWSGGIYDEARRGWIANLEDNQAAREAIRLQDWNEIEIEVRGASLKTWINGVPAADIIDGLSTEGFIALQVHSGDKGVIRWRNIRIKELPGMAIEGNSLLVADEWRNESLNESNFQKGVLSLNVPEAEEWLTSRRKFNDALVRMRVPACELPTTIRMRSRTSSNGKSTSYAEVKIFADRAEGRVVTPAGEKIMEPVMLDSAEYHTFVGVTLGDSTVLTVDESDAVRVKNVGLSDRGQFQILPARCGERFQISDLDWYSLKEASDEPLFYQTLDNKPAPVFTPEQAQDAFKLAPGFEIELVAAEPLVEDPVAMAWDELGRLYVVELRGYMPDAYGTGSEKPVGQVVRLEDTDGDGKMDSSEVFLGELVNPRAVAVVNEGVLIGEPPNLWLCELPKLDSMCENKRAVGNYAPNAADANVEHMENGLRQGLDNWLYNSKSNRQLRLVNGELKQREGKFRGQWGITKDDYGRWLYNHNSTWIQADFFAAEDLMEPEVKSQPEGLGINLTDPPEVFTVRVNPGVNRAYLDNTLREDGRLNRTTGVSGLVAYRGDQFPAQYRGDVFVPEAAGNVVGQFAMAEDGIALTATHRLYEDPQWGQREFLGSTDERFRPVDAMNGPDGALYIIDMYRGIIQDDHFLTDELREQIFERGLESPIGMGRIWRVRHTGGKTNRAFPVLGNASDSELVASLGHPNGWVRDTAQRLLLARPEVDTAELAALATGAETLGAIHAIWTLEGRGELSRDLVMQVAAGGDMQRQIQVLRAGRALLQVPDMLALSEQLAQAPIALKMQLAFAMGDHTADSQVREQLAALLTRELDDIYIRQAVVRAVKGEALNFLGEYLASNRINKKSEAAQKVLLALSASAYRSLRGDFGSSDPANPELLKLLALAESRSGDNAWQQIAMLKGLEISTGGQGFVPAQLEEAPDIFADSSVSESNPLWDARLAGRLAFTWPGDELALGITPLSPEQLQLVALGRAFYTKCAACHGDDGAGVAGLAPALAGASWVIGPVEWLGRIILQGMTGPVEVNGSIFEGLMPPHGHLAELDDATLAGLMTYLRRSWGNKADPVSVAAVTELRSASVGRGGPWTVAELEAVPFDRGYGRFVGKYSISFITMTISEEPDGLYISVPMYGGGRLDPVPGSKTKFSGTASGEDIDLEFVVNDDGAVNKMIMLREGEKIPVTRKN